MKKNRFKAECLKCGHLTFIEHESKEDYQEVSTCPECKGALVDVFKIEKYRKYESTARSTQPNRKLEAIFYKKRLFGVREVVFIVPTTSLSYAIVKFGLIEEHDNLYVEFDGRDWKLR